jgi:hypothetical protein
MEFRIAALLAAAVMTAGSGAALAAGSSSGGGESQQAPTLHVGSTGSSVKAVQRKLGVSVTGYFGSRTASAVKRFQRAHHLNADGVVGPATARALGVRVTGSSYASGGASPSSGQSSSSSGSVRLPAQLRKIAQCESGGNPRAVSSSGKYRGKFQFDMATWRSLGGKGDPAQAPESVQDRLALKLYRQRGTAPWANCA